MALERCLTEMGMGLHACGAQSRQRCHPAFQPQPIPHSGKNA